MAADRIWRARQAVRQHARQLLRQPRDVGAHLARLHASLELPGSEPVQGALADLFMQFGADEQELKRSAVQLAQGRLAPHVLRGFEARVAQAVVPRITPLATRWSVLARPSADIATRARRCSVDDSRLLAERAEAAWAAGDLAAQQEFLHHCVTCRDNLAFMLARRAVLRTTAVLPDEWQAVSLQLEQPNEGTP